MTSRSLAWAGFFVPRQGRFACLLGALLLTTVGCGPDKPEPEVASADPEPPPKLRPKPKPKCESFGENCAATADTQAKIAGSELVFIPPEGWLYAQQADVTLAKTDGSSGGMAVMGYAAGKADEAKARDQNYEHLLQLLELSPPEKFKVRYVPAWNKAEASRKSGDMEIKLWQADGAKRGGKVGFLNVLLGTDSTGKKILGVVFTPENDEKTADAVNKSLETIGPGSYQ
jgi:hypothetical protein